MLNFWRSSESDDSGFKEAHINESCDVELSNFFTADGERSSSFQYIEPDRKKALEYYEHQLPRRVRDALQPTGYRINVPGELRSHDGEAAELYNPWCATQDMIGEFGIGVDQYFYSLRLFNVLFMAAAFIGLVAIYANEKYNKDDTEMRLLGSTYGATTSSLKLNEQGLSDILCTFFLTMGFLVISYLLRERKHYIDDATYTTADYSVVVTNPDKEIQSPDEYREHFSRFGDVVLVTIVKNNGDLLKSITEKKVLQNRLHRERSIKYIAENNGKEYLDEENLSWPYKLFKPTVSSIKRKLDNLSTKIEGDMTKDFYPWRVYITFNKETERNQCLKETDRTTLENLMDNFGISKSAGAANILRGRILDVNPAHEPDEVYYKNSNSSPFGRVFSYILSYSICFLFIAVCYFIISGISSASADTTAAFISIINSVIPYLVKEVDKIEMHLNDSDAQLSAMLKLTVTRCFNSGILIYLSVAHKDRFGQEALGQIQSILIADAISTPLLRILDLPGLYNRYISSRSAVTQHQLDLLWSPSEWTLSERYTDTLKTVFVGMMYAVPLPSGLFITSFAMITTYVVDKYSLFRLWKRPSSLNHQLAKMSQYFMFALLWTHVFFSRLFFANWPFEENLIARCGFWVCRTSWEYDNEIVKMDTDQRKVVEYYNGFSVFFFVALILISYKVFFSNFVYKHLYRTGFKTESNNTVTFRSLNKSQAYVPHVKHPSLTMPVLFSDIGALPPKLAPIYDGADDFSDAPRDPTVFSVVNTAEFPNLSERDLAAVFSEVAFYDESKQTDQIYTVDANGGSRPQSADLRRNKRASLSVDEDGKQLPHGWAMKRTEEGRVYYINHVNRTTQWSKPP